MPKSTVKMGDARVEEANQIVAGYAAPQLACVTYSHRVVGTVLTLKQQLFVDAYLGPARGNLAEAARRAGYKGSAKTPSQVGRENLVKPGIRASIEERLRASAMGADEVRRPSSDLKPLAFEDLLKALERDYEVRGLHSLP
jgi:hypothetical protein